MTNIIEKTEGYGGKETDARVGTAVSFLKGCIGKRISAACDLIGTRTSAAQAIGISVDSLQRYIREERFPSLEVAAALSTISGVRLEWLAFGTEPMKASEAVPQSHSQTVRLDALTIALGLVDEALDGKFLPREKRAELTGLVYDMLVQGLPEATVLRFIRAMKGD
jgi:hypothetical protein